MQISDTLNRLVHLPREFNSIDNTSMYDLLFETGYFEIRDKITVEIIRDRLAQSPEYVKDWLHYSEDKRSRSGWYFKQQDNKVYCVGYLSDNGNASHNECHDRLKACAIFIKNEMESIISC